MYKTSTSDTVCRYIYGDIYYSFKGTLGKNGSINKPVEGGNYRLVESQVPLIKVLQHVTKSVLYLVFLLKE